MLDVLAGKKIVQSVFFQEHKLTSAVSYGGRGESEAVYDRGGQDGFWQSYFADMMKTHIQKDAAS